MTKETARSEIQRLVAGFRRFHHRFYDGANPLYQKLATGQNPKTLMIACSDSRVDPAILSSALPGELFVVRNVANLVPPFENSDGFHGVSSAIEFAVVNLKVENVVILGHRQCGGIRSLFSPEIVTEGGFVQKWMRIASPAHDKVAKRMPGADLDTLCRECEKESIVESIANLMSFPFVQKAMAERDLSVLGIYFDLEEGQLLQYDGSEFRQIDLDSDHN